MGWFEGFGSAVVGVIKKAIMAVILLVVLAALISWGRSNPSQAQATTNKVMGAGASVIGWAADGVTSMTGGQAAEAAGAGGAQVVYIHNAAPLRWHVGAAIKVWNKGLTNVQLEAVQECPSDVTCFEVSQVPELPPTEGRLTLGKTHTFINKRIDFNGAAVGQVPARSLAVSACHELGHALGAEHRTVATSCMDKVIGPGVSTRPDKADFAKVNDKFGH